MNRLLQLLFFVVFVRPLTWVVLGMNVHRRKILPTAGPAIIAANHNSHLDTLVLLSLFPLKQLKDIRPVAGATYFGRYPALNWFVQNILGIIFVQPGSGQPHEQVLSEVFAALDEGQIIIIFPEGTRGKPEQLGPLRPGIATLATRRPDIPVVPVYLNGLGKVLPKDTSMLVPFICNVHVAPPIRGAKDPAMFLQGLQRKLEELCEEGQFPA